jgi:DNA (cytosine-5)-methyltransferase 1
MRHGSLFSGIGGFDLASEWMGWENVFHCEWNPFGQKVLNYYWPNSITYNDITKTDFTIHRGGIDIITGGFPCQPYSSAGKRLGKEDERHLWPEMLRAIREIQPTWVVGENVRGLTNWNGGLVFDEVQAELEAQGYEVTPFLLPACAVNAPHRRDRIWFIAYSKSCADSRNSRRISNETKEKNGGWIESGSSSQQQVQLPTESSSLFGDVSDPSSLRFCEHSSRQKLFSETFGTQLGMDKQNDSYSQNQGLEGMRGEERRYSKLHRRQSRIENWTNFPTVSPICNGDDGLSDRLDSITFPKWRNESIKAGGNAIVPQVVYQIFKAIEKYNQLDKQLSI